MTNKQLWECPECGHRRIIIVNSTGTKKISPCPDCGRNQLINVKHLCALGGENTVCVSPVRLCQNCGRKYCRSHGSFRHKICDSCLNFPARGTSSDWGDEELHMLADPEFGDYDDDYTY